MDMICVFGPSDGDTPGNYKKMKECLDAIKRPIVIVTSTTAGWDAMGRRYAEENKSKRVFKCIIKADMSLGWKTAVSSCNEWMESIVAFGITQKGAITEGTLDMIAKLEASGKSIFFL